MSPRAATAVLSLAVALVGLILGLMPVHAGTVSCGSAFSPSSSDATLADSAAEMRLAIQRSMTGITDGTTATTAQACTDGTDGRRVWSLVLLGAGGLGVAFVGLTAARPAQRVAAA